MGRPSGMIPGLTLTLTLALAVVACGNGNGTGPVRATGYVEATEVRVAPEVGGRVLTMAVEEGDRAEADHDQAVAQLRLLQAGARPEDIRQAAAQVDSASAEVRAAESELAAAD